MCFDWNALSTIATFLAVIVALFIPYLQDIISNRKNIKIEWKYTHGSSLDKYADILITLVNTGNRKVVIRQIKFMLKDGRKVPYDNIYIKFNLLNITLPRAFEIEEIGTIKIFGYDFKSFIEKNKFEPLQQEIILVVVDTTGKEWLHRTGCQYSDYIKLNHFDLQQSP